MIRSVLSLVAAVLALSAAGAARAGEQPEIRLEPGQTSVIVEGAVAAHDRDIHPFTARAGQRVRVVVTSTQGNAAFDIYLPGSSVFRNEDDLWAFRGEPLRGADAGRDTTVWEGVLPRTGRYLIVVGPTRMNAVYSLRIEAE